LIAEQNASFIKAKTDTLWVPGVYRVDSIPIYYPIIHNAAGRVDTIACPEVSGSIGIDTFKTFGPESNPLSVKVRGRFYWPQKYSSLNWLQIMPEYAKNNAIQVPQPFKIPILAVGLGAFAQSNGEAGPCAQIGYNRLNGFIGYGMPSKHWIGILSYAVLKF
jgi:hypothetical protein